MDTQGYKDHQRVGCIDKINSKIHNILSSLDNGGKQRTMEHMRTEGAEEMDIPLNDKYLESKNFLERESKKFSYKYEGLERAGRSRSVL